MISRLNGTLLSLDGERVEIETGGGVVYEVEVPLTVLQKLPTPGSPVQLRTLQVVTESSTALYGFLEPLERALFQRLLTASGVGPKLALQMMSTFRAERLAVALLEKDLAALTQVSGIGKKKAERIALELADKVDDLVTELPSGASEATTSAQEAVRALVRLGYTFGDADQAVRQVLEDGGAKSTDELIRRALAE